MDKTKISKAFSRAAISYDTLALFQRQICERMCSLLPKWLPKEWVPKRLLDGGCGTGFGAQCLTTLWPDASLIGCDLSVAMVKCMRQKGFSAIVGDLEALPFSKNNFDFVWSSLALQWCRPDVVFHELFRGLTHKGILYFSTLIPGTLAEIRYAFAKQDNTHRILDFYPIATLKDLLQKAGFSEIRIITETHTMYYPDVRSAIDSVRGIGAGYSGGKRQALLGKDAWKAIQKRYESLRNNNGLPVTYELAIGYGIANK